MINPEVVVPFMELIEQKLASVSTDYATDYAAYRDSLRKLEQELIEEAGARFGHSNGALTMRLAGVSTTCTSGLPGLLRNWLNSARGKVADAGCTLCQTLPVLRDPAGREMREYLTEFRIDGRTFGDSVIAYDLADAERLVSDMRNSLRVVGEVVERGQI